MPEQNAEVISTTASAYSGALLCALWTHSKQLNQDLESHREATPVRASTP